MRMTMMMRSRLPGWMRLLLTGALLVGMSLPTFAQVASNTAPLEFRDAQEEARFHALAEQLRCVMCQNQSLADSNAQIARDLRVEVLNLMRQGKSDPEVKAFLVQRYGEFVLYQPPVSGRTWLLWFGPLLLLLAGTVVVWRIVKTRKPAASSTSASPTIATTDDTEEW